LAKSTLTTKWTSFQVSAHSDEKVACPY
jgi:hypothetical protein